MTETSAQGVTTRSFFAGSVAQFLASDDEAILGRLAERLAALHGASEHDQIRAWRAQCTHLRAAFNALGETSRSWGLLFECPLLRLGRRMDVVLLLPGVVVVIEFKVGATSFQSADVAQTEYYALCLRDFHEASQERVVVPVLCADVAPASRLASGEPLDGIAPTQRVNAAGLVDAVRVALRFCATKGDVDPLNFERSAYQPTPGIVEAARALYAGNSVREIGRGDAAAEELERASQRLDGLVREAERERKHVICFVTGTPGAGKTLLGLNLALKSRVAGGGLPPASLLSGNPPLVHVLTEALALDASRREGVTMRTARHQARTAIQGLLQFLKEHTDGAPPPERVIVFDEAQRAWDASVGERLMQRPRSEPALFLDIMARHEWCCLVCLVGPGQEINRGEGGLALWGEALQEAVAAGAPWEIRAAPDALYGGPSVDGAGLMPQARKHELFDDDTDELSGARPEPLLHLANSVRSYRSPLQVKWVSALLSGDVVGARRIADDMDAAPALITRDLAAMRNWLKAHRRGGRTVGLLASSSAKRLIAEGLPPTPVSTDLDTIAHWFLKPYEDYRSSGSLEVPLSEFGCQGLELDHVGLAWGSDLLWQRGEWLTRKISGPAWRNAYGEKRQFLLNVYRVLLTRARAGLVIFVPSGDAEDATRDPTLLDETAELLRAAGCVPLA